MKKCLLAILAACILISCGSQKTEGPKSEPAKTFETDGGLTYTVKKIENDYKAAADTLIKEQLPDASLQNDWIFGEYSDGVTSTTVTAVSGGQKYIATIIIKFKDDTHTDYMIKYFSLGDNVILDDGTYNTPDYQF